VSGKSGREKSGRESAPEELGGAKHYERWQQHGDQHQDRHDPNQVDGKLTQSLKPFTH